MTRPSPAIGLAPLVVSLAPLAVLLAAAPTLAEPPRYPETPVQEATDEYFGESIRDPYRWLEDAESPAVRAWEDAQAALTESLLGRFPERAAVRAELERYWSSHVAESPEVHGDRYFYRRRDGLKNQPLLYLRVGSMQARERVVLDPNGFREDGTAALDWFHPSPDGRLLAYGVSEAGDEISTLYLLDVDSGKLLADRIRTGRACALAWDPDHNGFLYTRYPEPGSVPKGDENYFRRVYHHRLGTDPKDDPLVAGEGRPREEWVDVSLAQGGQYVLMTRSLDWAKNDLLLRRAGESAWREAAVGLDGQTTGDVSGEILVLRTNVGAPRGRVVRAPVATPGPEHWREIVPESEGVLQEMVVAGDRIVLHSMVDACSQVEVFDLDGKRLALAPLPTLGTVRDVGRGRDGKEVFFHFESFVFPDMVARWDLGKRLETIEQAKVDLDLSAFETKQLWYESKDGTRVPLFVAHRKGIPLDGSHAALLSGYGGFDISKTPVYQRNRLVWLSRGGIYAEACLRGGGEFGRAWHEAGRLERKQNVFDDFQAAAEALIRRGYTTPSRLAIDGRSNGGLLTGACLVQRPDLYRAVVVGVPLLDMLRYHLFSIARLWIPEYGSSEDPEQYRFLKAYSPYQNARQDVDYPAVLLHTGEADSRVDPMHARKMTALLQASTTSDRPILFRIERRGGHGQGKPLTKSLDENADIYTFLLWQTGFLAEPGATAPARSSSVGAR
jgi:prolyl oligopeptidase